MTLPVSRRPRRAVSREYSLSLRLDLQGMRAFAVLAVFADHLFGWPSGGFIGVDVFFVLSGFFITGLLIGERTRKKKISFKNFYIRRVRRIIPSALLVITLTVIASQFLLTATRARGALIDGLWAAIFFSNWRFERVGTDYFAQGQPDSPLLHYWSLSIEEQFYFVWPVLLAALFALTRRYSKRGKRYPAARFFSILVCMASICVVSFAWACMQSGSNPTGAYFSTLTRVWELGVGAIVAISAPLLSRIPSKIRPYISYIGFAGATASLFVITSGMAFPGPWAALPVVSTAVVIAAFVGAETRAVPHLTNPVALYVGEVSYTLYLWHWPIIVLLAAVLPKGPAYFVLAIAATSALTFITYRYFENPIRHSSWLEARREKSRVHPKQWALVGGSVASVILVSAIALENGSQRDSMSQSNQRLEVPSVAPRFDEARRCFGAAALSTKNCAINDPQKSIYPAIDDFADDTQGAYECYREESQPLRSCTYGYKGSDAKRIAIVGDSHAAMLIPALSQDLIENKWQLTTFVGYYCQWRIRSGPGDCNEVMSEVQMKLLAEKFDLVIVTGGRRFGGGPAVAESVAAWRPVAEAGSKILAITDNPGITADTLDCVTRVPLGNHRSWDCATPRNVALSDSDPVPDAAKQVPGTALLDMTDLYCLADRCPTVIGNVIVYRDAAAHVTATYARSLSPRIVAAVKAALA